VTPEVVVLPPPSRQGVRERGGRGAVVALLALAGCSSVTPPGPARAAAAPPSATASAALVAEVPVRTVFGRSVRHRDLVALRLGPADARRRVLVVGVVHGDEAAGLPIVEALLRTPPPAGTELVVVPDLNPDGVAAHTRQNADGVDLNRSFPYRWERIGRRGDQQYSGTRALAEPESRAMVALVRQVRPTATVWFHQPVGVVDDSGGAPAVERRFAAAIGLPLRRLERYPGSATGWQDATMPGTSAFVVELPRSVTSQLLARALTALRGLEVDPTA